MDKLKQMENYIDKNWPKCGFKILYPFTTENINGYLDLFDLKNKSLLTLGSSSDQAINAGLVGCKDITIFDICPLTKIYYFLKLSSLLSLEREIFLKFLCKTKYKVKTSNNPDLYKNCTFNKIKDTLKSLDYESYVIWDYLFSKYKSEEISRLFTIDINQIDSIIGCNRYLVNDDMYQLARKMMPDVNIKFIEGDVLAPYINEKYDNVWLSNVGKYMMGENFSIVMKKMSSLLKQNGSMLINYFYSTLISYKIEKALDDYEYEKIIISGEPLNHIDNSILLYKRK